MLLVLVLERDVHVFVIILGDRSCSEEQRRDKQQWASGASASAKQQTQMNRSGGGGSGKKAATPTNSKDKDIMASSSNRHVGLQIGSAWFQRKINLRPQHRGVHLVTEEILRQIPELSCFSVGLCHVQSNYRICIDSPDPSATAPGEC